MQDCPVDRATPALGCPPLPRPVSERVLSAMLSGPRTASVSVAVVLCCVGALLAITACGFVPPARPTSPPDTFVLLEDVGPGNGSPLHRVLGHGSLSLTNSLHARADITLYGQPGEPVSTIETIGLQGFVVLVLPRRLLLHGSSGKAAVSLSALAPGPLSGDGNSGFLPFTGLLKLGDPGASRQIPVRAELYTRDYFRLQLPATGADGQKTSFALLMTLWPGDLPESSHIAAELQASAPCRAAAQNDERVSTDVTGPFSLDLRTPQGGTAHLQLVQPLGGARARPDLIQGFITFTGGPCGGQRYTLGDALSQLPSRVN